MLRDGVADLFMSFVYVGIFLEEPTLMTMARECFNFPLPIEVPEDADLLQPLPKTRKRGARFAE